jgi:CRP/FNR family transcriptional regulator|tara:strand:- start:1940 stop:2068 length:129 start_codon:yes stop_codon:yes gene_type:complete
MIKELKDNYGLLFEDALLKEINQVGTFKEVPEGFKKIYLLYL